MSVELGTVKKQSGGPTAYILRAKDEDWIFSPVPTFEFSHDQIKWMRFDSEDQALRYVCLRIARRGLFHHVWNENAPETPVTTHPSGAEPDSAK